VQDVTETSPEPNIALKRPPNEAFPVSVVHVVCDTGLPAALYIVVMVVPPFVVVHCPPPPGVLPQVVVGPWVGVGDGAGHVLSPPPEIKPTSFNANARMINLLLIDFKK